MTDEKQDKLIDFTPSLINELERAERLVRVAITGPPTGALVGRILTEKEAEAFRITAEILLERYLYLKNRR